MNTAAQNSFKLAFSNKSMSLTMFATYKPLGNGVVRVVEKVVDYLDCLPSETTVVDMPVEQARSDWKQKIKSGWLKA